MATTRLDRAEIRDDGSVRETVRRHVEVNETKPSFKTTELIVMLAGVLAVLIASSQDDSLDGRWAWTLVAAIAIGYMISRGLAKSGSAYRDDD
jgi:hypothetical protein